MTEKHDYTASVRRKGLENTGVTPDIAKAMYNTQGRTTLAIVELAHKRQINDDDTGRSVELVITSLEPSQDQALDDHLRQLMRTLHQNRVLHSEDATLDIKVAGDVEPSVDQVIAAQRAHAASEPHVYDPADGTDECDVCGEALEHDLHALDLSGDAQVQPCPECAAGKHPNCTEQVPDPADEDELVPCPCAEAGHTGPDTDPAA